MTVLELKEYIFTNKKIEYILKDIGCKDIKYNSNKEYYSTAQPDGDNPMGIVIYNNKNLTYCSYSRGILFENVKDVINLIEDVKKCSFIKAIEYIHNLLGINYNPKKFTIKATEKQVNYDPLFIFKKHAYNRTKNDVIALDESFLDDYSSILHIDWLREGITPMTAKKFGIAFSYARSRIIIPMRYWATGDLLGINARTTVIGYKELGIKKYFLTPTYNKNSNLFGLFENYESIQKAGYVVIVEAEKSVLKRDSVLDSTLVALSGHTMSAEQVAILLGLDVDIIIALDKDVSIEEVWNMCEKFYQKRNVYFLFDKDGLLGDKDSPVDKGDEIYKLLFLQKIKYGYSLHKEFVKRINKCKGR